MQQYNILLSYVFELLEEQLPEYNEELLEPLPVNDDEYDDLPPLISDYEVEQFEQQVITISEQELIDNAKVNSN